MVTAGHRARLRATLLDKAAADSQISAAAVTGSAAGNAEDDWSDIDLAFSVADPDELQNVLAEWTAYMYREFAALHHLDITAGPWIYRVFLVPGTLQIDLAFVPSTDFRALAPTFRLIFGEAGAPQHESSPPRENLIGMGWLYALHARTSMARNRLWQAEYMVSGLRDHALALACLRHGLPAVHARGIHLLPKELQAAFEQTLVAQLTGPEIRRAFEAVIDLFHGEIAEANPTLAARLGESLRAL